MTANAIRILVVVFIGCGAAACALETSPLPRGPSETPGEPGGAQTPATVVPPIEQDAPSAEPASTPLAAPGDPRGNDPMATDPMPSDPSAGDPMANDPPLDMPAAPNDPLVPDPSAQPADPAQDLGDVQPVGSDPDPVTCSAVVTGAATVVNTTLIVGSGETFDGHCQRFVAGSAIAFASDVPLFRMEDGARLINVVLGSPAADGIHTYGNASLSNVTWQDVGEDALTINARGTVEIDGGSASRADDTVFKINAPGTLRVSEFRARDALKFIRQDASMTAAAELFIDRCDISGMSEAIARTDTSASHVTMTDTRYSAIGGALFMGFSPLNVITSGNSRY